MNIFKRIKQSKRRLGLFLSLLALLIVIIVVVLVNYNDTRAGASVDDVVMSPVLTEDTEDIPETDEPGVLPVLNEDAEDTTETDEPVDYVDMSSVVSVDYIDMSSVLIEDTDDGATVLDRINRGPDEIVVQNTKAAITEYIKNNNPDAAEISDSYTMFSNITKSEIITGSYVMLLINDVSFSDFYYVKFHKESGVWQKPIVIQSSAVRQNTIIALTEYVKTNYPEAINIKPGPVFCLRITDSEIIPYACINFVINDDLFNHYYYVKFHNESGIWQKPVVTEQPVDYVDMSSVFSSDSVEPTEMGRTYDGYLGSVEKVFQNTVAALTEYIENIDPNVTEISVIDIHFAGVTASTISTSAKVRVRTSGISVKQQYVVSFYKESGVWQRPVVEQSMFIGQ